MENIDDILKRFKELLFSLDERGILSYWIFGEYREAEIYFKLADKAEELGFGPGLISAFRKLARESIDHGDSLRRIYGRTYGGEPRKVDLPYIEAEVLARAFEDPENIPRVLTMAMETELVAMELYKHLASITEDEEAKKVYQYLADVEWTHYQRLKGEAELMGFSVENQGIKVRVTA